ncbi:hypothetical protein [Flavobacterium sp.]|uniref:hypothetical protein n=1 Tax=Flavobacterium sp. TaxID=239 RepID=UPI002FDB0C89
MELLGSYSISRLTTDTYNLSYNIPVNCETSVKQNDDLFEIFITLKENETQPSVVFFTETTICTAYNNLIYIEFHQQDLSNNANGNSLKKPTIRIDVNG